MAWAGSPRPRATAEAVVAESAVAEEVSASGFAGGVRWVPEVCAPVQKETVAGGECGGGDGDPVDWDRAGNAAWEGNGKRLGVAVSRAGANRPWAPLRREEDEEGLAAVAQTALSGESPHVSRTLPAVVSGVLAHQGAPLCPEILRSASSLAVPSNWVASSPGGLFSGRSSDGGRKLSGPWGLGAPCPASCRRKDSGEARTVSPLRKTASCFSSPVSARRKGLGCPRIGPCPEIPPGEVSRGGNCRGEACGSCPAILYQEVVAVVVVVVGDL